MLDLWVVAEQDMERAIKKRDGPVPFFDVATNMDAICNNDPELIELLVRDQLAENVSFRAKTKRKETSREVSFDRGYGRPDGQCNYSEVAGTILSVGPKNQCTVTVDDFEAGVHQVWEPSSAEFPTKDEITRHCLPRPLRGNHTRGSINCVWLRMAIWAAGLLRAFDREEFDRMWKLVIDAGVNFPTFCTWVCWTAVRHSLKFTGAECPSHYDCANLLMSVDVVIHHNVTKGHLLLHDGDSETKFLHIGKENRTVGADFSRVRHSVTACEADVGPQEEAQIRSNSNDPSLRLRGGGSPYAVRIAAIHSAHRTSTCSGYLHNRGARELTQLHKKTLQDAHGHSKR